MKKHSTLNAADRERYLAQLDRTGEEEINTNAPDSHIVRPDQLASARPFHETFRPRKTSINLRVDNDVLDYFKTKGEGYQTRMNAALREKMNAERQQTKSPAVR